MRANRKLQESLRMSSMDDVKIKDCEVFNFDASKIKPYDSRTERTLDNTRNNIIDIFR